MSVGATVREVRRAGEIGQTLSQWFPAGGRSFPWRLWRDPYRLAVVELLLQRTQAERVASFTDGFFERYPDWTSLRDADLISLETCLTPLGLYRRRARVLIGLAQSVLSDPEGAWELRPGVGQYVSRALGVMLDRKPVAMVDSNFVRVLRRAFAGPWKADYRYDRRLQELAGAVVAGAGGPAEVNWAVLDVGALICKPRHPDCGACPIRYACATAAPGEPN